MAERFRRRTIPRVDRYVAPGVLCLLRHRDAILLIEGARRKRWSGRFQGIGGGIQSGEHPLQAALREIREETGLRLTADDLQIKGVIHSQRFYGTSKLVVIMVGRTPGRRVRGGEEGKLHWVPLRALSRAANLIPDLYTLIPRVLALRPGESLSGVAVYDGKGGLLSMELMKVKE